MTVIALPTADWIDRVGPVPGAEFVVWDLTGEPDRREEIELLVAPYPTPNVGLERLGDLPNLKVLQVLMAGYDNVVAHLPTSVELCNAAGVHDTATAELTLALILAAQRGLPEFVRAQARGEWITVPMQPGLADKKVMIIGYGGIGASIAARLAPFEVQITAVATRSRPGDEHVTSVHGIDELPVLLPDQDIVVVIVPLTPSTERLVDAGFLEAMKEGALLVNVARGKVVQTDALIEACSSGRVRAALDVTDPEPLPSGHPLFSTPGVLISPHVGGPTQAFAPRAATLLHEQFTAYVAGEPLRNVIDLPR